MIKFRKNILVASIAVVSVGPGISLAAQNATPPKWNAGHILVKPKAGLSEKNFNDILKKNQAASVKQIDGLPVHLVSVPVNAEEAIANALSKNPSIEFAELDRAVKPTYIPNDPSLPSAWQISKINAESAWDISKGNGVTIAILDTGVEPTHPDLAAHLLPGYNAVDGSTNSSDVMGHGTAVAGAAAAIMDNGTGFSGVAGQANILPVRITNDSTGYAYWSDIANGLTWAANNGADVANISYSVSDSSSVTSAAQYMKSKGGLVVAAAGNDGIELTFADNPYIITVSATDSADAKASWSNYGNAIDVSAPGVSDYLTRTGGGYGYGSGTSFASPTTAGVVGLIQGANVNLNPNDVENILQSSADKVAGVDFHSYYGYGRVNAAIAVQTAINTVPSDAEAPIANIFSPTAGATVKGIVSVDVGASDNVAVNQVSLYANNVLIGTDTVAPYSFSWDTATIADGSVNLSAIAVDPSGNQGTSSAVKVTVKNTVTVADTTLPSVSFGNPVNGSKVSGTVAVSVKATDNVAVSKTQLFIDGKRVSGVSSGNLSYNWNTTKVKAGNHTLKAVATDSSNNVNSVSITVSK